MENRPIKILYQGGSGEIVEKKSRFIATIEKIETEEEALAFIGKIKKQYWDARHNCYAFVMASQTVPQDGRCLMCCCVRISTILLWL